MSWSDDAATRFASENQNRITALWQDIHTGSTGDDIFIDDSIAGQVTFGWDATSRADGADVTFAVRLYEDGGLEFLYGDSAGLDGVAGLTNGMVDRMVSVNQQTSTATNTAYKVELLPGYTDLGALEFRGASDDVVAPLVSQTVPASIAESQIVDTTFDSIDLQFSEEVNLFDASSFAAYELREAGVNGTFGDGDDTVLDLTPQAQLGGSVVRLQLAEGQLLTTQPTVAAAPLQSMQTTTDSSVRYLPEGNYRFQLASDPTGSVRDTAGLATDGDGDGSPGGTYVKEFEVRFHPELLSLDVTPAIHEGDLATLSGTFRDLSNAVSHSLEIDWGDGSPLQTIAIPAGEHSFNIDRPYLQDSLAAEGGVFNIVATVRSDLDRVGVNEAIPLAISVANVLPAITSIEGPPLVNEGESFTLSGTFLDPGSSDIPILSIDWGDGTPAQQVTLAAGDEAFSVAHLFSDEASRIEPQSRTISLSIFDGTGSSSVQTWPIDLVTINTPPSIPDQSLSVLEMSVAGTVVGQVSNLDPDLVSPNEDNQSFRIIGGTGLGRFEIDGQGVVTVAQGVDLDREETPSYTLYVEATDGRGESDLGLIQVELANVTEVGSIIIDDGSGQRSSVRSITLQFDTEVALAEDAIQIETGDGQIFSPVVTTATVAGRTTATLTFSGPHSQVGGSLTDGNYVLRILSAKVTSSDAAMRSDAIDSFFRLFGDTDGDRDVDGQDYGRFGLSFLKSAGTPGFNPALDFDGDGDIDGQDYGHFGRRCLKRLSQ
jgi:hypothetical protein